jgi:hypothetical protein
MKALKSSTGNYAKFLVKDLPEGASAGGIRPGAINMLASRMPTELACCTTGHELASMSAFFNYLDCS